MVSSVGLSQEWCQKPAVKGETDTISTWRKVQTSETGRDSVVAITKNLLIRRLNHFIRLSYRMLREPAGACERGGCCVEFLAA